MALCPGLPRWAGTRKVKPIRILLKQETVSGSGIIWAICKSAPRSRQITTPVPHHSVFYRPDALPAAQPTASKHWRQIENALTMCNIDKCWSDDVLLQQDMDAMDDDIFKAKKKSAAGPGKASTSTPACKPDPAPTGTEHSAAKPKGGRHLCACFIHK